MSDAAGTVNAALAAQIHALRATVSPEGVPCGLLAWWGRHDFPDGVEHVPIVAPWEWDDWVLRLQFAGAQVPTGGGPNLLAIKGMVGVFRPDGPLPIAIVDYRVAVPSDAFTKRVWQAAKAGVALNPAPGELQAEIEESHAFVACGLMHDQWDLREPEYRGRDVTFQLDERFYFRNAGDPLPDHVELDPGDGIGFRPLSFGETLDVEYSLADRADAVVRCHTRGVQRSARFTVKLSPRSAPPAPDETWALRGANGNTGRAMVYRAPGRTELAHPLILAEGFPGGYAYDYLYELLNQHDTLVALHGAGYDVVFVGFDKGFDLIQNNADVVIACVEEAMRRTPNPLVVGGVSMGGLVSRYALAAMETEKREHRTRIFVTLDTPHRGAYTNVCDQWFAHYFRTSSPEAATISAVLDSPANQQFMMLSVIDGRLQESPERKEFVAALAKVGNYPQRPRRLAIASGSGGGARSMPPHQLALRWSESPFTFARLWTLPEGAGGAEVVGEGYSLLADPSAPRTLSVTSEVSWEGAPGGENLYNFDADQVVTCLGCGKLEDPIPRTCSVPTVSALDLDVGPFTPVPPQEEGHSPFHDYICCEKNKLHVRFTPEVKRWLLEKLGTPTA